jgi:phosphatidylglycerol:prolipoprotein diacylglycerol transferase
VNPVLLDIEVLGAHVRLGAYGTFMAVAWLVGVAVGTFAAHRRGLPWRRALALFAISLAAGIVGARLFDLWIAGDYYAEDASRIWAVGFAGFSLYGGLLGAGLVGLAFARAWRLPVWRLADATVPGIAAAVLLMRAGCLSNGCCYGTATSLPWGLVYPTGSPVWLHQVASGQTGFGGLMSGAVLPVHPTQAYEMLAAVLLAGAALLLVRRHAAEGVPFLVFATGFTLFRLANGFLRVRQEVLSAPEWFYPVFYAVLAGVFATLLMRRLRTPALEPPPLPARPALTEAA